jgi:hypothetical protein
MGRKGRFPSMTANITAVSFGNSGNGIVPNIISRILAYHNKGQTEKLCLPRSRHKQKHKHQTQCGSVLLAIIPVLDSVPSHLVHLQ